MDSDLAWVNGKSARQSWCYADDFKRCIISGAVYHFTIYFIVSYAVHKSGILLSKGDVCQSVRLYVTIWQIPNISSRFQYDILL